MYRYIAIEKIPDITHIIEFLETTCDDESPNKREYNVLLYDTWLLGLRSIKESAYFKLYPFAGGRSAVYGE